MLQNQALPPYLHNHRLASPPLIPPTSYDTVNIPIPASLEVGALLETPTLAFAPEQFYEEVQFLSIGGNDLTAIHRPPCILVLSMLDQMTTKVFYPNPKDLFIFS